MSDGDTAIGVGGGGFAGVSGHGVKLDEPTFTAAYEEVRAAGFKREQPTSAATLLAGLRSGQRPYVTRGDAPLVDAIAEYLVRKGEHGTALDALVYLD